MSRNGTNDGLSFDIFDVSKHKNDKEFHDIAELFEKSEPQLCIHNKKKIVNLHDHFNKEIGFLCEYVYYIKKKNQADAEIIAFAFITKTNGQNIYTVSILCSHKKKYLYQNEKPGIFLLNKLYDDFVSKEKGVLCIEPATTKLIPYYTNWKTPSYSPYNNLHSEGVSTGGYLLYFEDIDNITDEMLYTLVYELESLRLIKQHISVSDWSYSKLNKEYLQKKIDSIDGSDGIKKQLKLRLDDIKYFTIEEYRNHIREYQRKNSRTLIGTPYHNEPNMDDEKRRLIHTILEGFCKDFRKETDDISDIFNDVECSKIYEYMDDRTINDRISQCTKECYIYKLIENVIDEKDLLFLEGLIRGYASDDMKQMSKQGEDFQDHLSKVQELRFRNLSEYKKILSYKLRKIFIKLYKRYALINNLKKPLQTYIDDDDKEQDKYLFEKIAEKYPIIEHTEEVNETFKYKKGIAEYFYAIYIANRLINNRDDLSSICDEIKNDAEVKNQIEQIETNHPPVEPNVNDAIHFALDNAHDPEIKSKALKLQEKNTKRFESVPFGEKKDLIERLYSLIIENVDTVDFLNNLLDGKCSKDNKKKENEETIDLDIEDYMPTIDAVLTEQFEYRSPNEFLKNTIIGRYVNRFTTSETIRNRLIQMENANYQSEEETKYSHTDEEVTIQGNKLVNNKIVKETYKWKKFDRYLNPNRHRSIFNITGRLKKKKDVKGGLEIKVLYKGNIFEGELWRGPSNDSDDVWKQSIDKNNYSFAVNIETGPLLFPKDTLVHIPELSSRGGRTRRKRRVNRRTRKK